MGSRVNARGGEELGSPEDTQLDSTERTMGESKNPALLSRHPFSVEALMSGSRTRRGPPPLRRAHRRETRRWTVAGGPGPHGPKLFLLPVRGTLRSRRGEPEALRVRTDISGEVRDVRVRRLRTVDHKRHFLVPHR